MWFILGLLLTAADGKPADEAVGRSVKPAEAAAAARPDWVDRPAGRVGDGYQVVVVCGPFTTDAECLREMPERVRAAIADYALTHLGRGLSPVVVGRLPLAGTEVVRERWTETIATSVGPMQQLHLRLVFDKKSNFWLEGMVRQTEVRRRVTVAGTLFAAVLACVAAAWTYLRIDLRRK